jgi:hypothetical protein
VVQFRVAPSMGLAESMLASAASSTMLLLTFSMFLLPAEEEQ